MIGGACVTPLTGIAGDNAGMKIAMVVPLVFFIGPWSFAFCVNFVPYYRNIADAFHETTVGVRSASGARQSRPAISEKPSEEP